MLVNMMEADEIAARLKTGRSGAQERRGQHRQRTQGDRDRSRRRWRRVVTTQPGRTRGARAADFPRHAATPSSACSRDGKGSPWPKRPTASARCATCACARRSTTRSAATTRSYQCDQLPAHPLLHRRARAIRRGPRRGHAPGQQHVDPDAPHRDHRVHRRRGSRQPGSCRLRRPRRRRSGNMSSPRSTKASAAPPTTSPNIAACWPLSNGRRRMGHTASTSSRIHCCSSSRSTVSTASRTKDCSRSIGRRAI